MLNGEDLHRKPYVERKAALRKLLRHGRGIQYVEHAEGHGDRLFEAVCKVGLEGIVSKKLDALYRSGPSRTWIKVKNPKAPAALSMGPFNSKFIIPLCAKALDQGNAACA
jgi:bifunctional non-homologous end joining protein LigD